MNIMIAGCGKIGSTITESLVSEGHSVAIVDNDPAVVSEMTNICDVMGVCGNGADCETLEAGGVSSADLFVAVTGSDEFNMLSCFMAKKMGAQHTIARIRNPEYNEHSLGFMRQALDISMPINPELLTAHEIYNLLKFPSAVKIETFSQRDFEMIEIKLADDSPLDGLSLRELREKYNAKVLVSAVRRGSEVRIPDGRFVLHAGDRLGLTAAPAEIQKFMKAIGALRRQARSVMILGGSMTAHYLAKRLTAAGTAVKIIERDPEICERLAADLPRAVVICGDGARQELLIEEGLTSHDAFVSLTGMDEENILMSFFAASQNVPVVIAKLNRDEMMPLAGRLGLEYIVSPKKIISDVLVRYARALQNSIGSSVETLYKLMDGKVEALEFKVGSGLSLLEVPLKELNLKPGILIAGIIRDRKTIIPAGDDRIMSGDRVIVIAAGQTLGNLSDILDRNGGQQ